MNSYEDANPESSKLPLQPGISSTPDTPSTLYKSMLKKTVPANPLRVRSHVLPPNPSPHHTNSIKSLSDEDDSPAPTTQTKARPSEVIFCPKPNQLRPMRANGKTVLDCKIFWEQTFASFLERNFGLQFAVPRGIWRIRKITAEICRICQICPATLKIKLNCDF